MAQVILSPQQRTQLHKSFIFLSDDGGDSISTDDVLKLAHLVGFNPNKNDIKNALEEAGLSGQIRLGLEQCEIVISNVYEDNVEDALRKAFHIFDKDKNGYLDRQEFEKFMCSYGERFTKDEFDQMMNMFDIDNNGQIIYEELIKALVQPSESVAEEETNEEQEAY